MASRKNTKVNPNYNDLVGSNNPFNGTLDTALGYGGGKQQDTHLTVGFTSLNQANYGNLLDYLGSLPKEDLGHILAALGVNTGDMSQGQAVDWNKQLLDNQLALLSEQEKRKYNEGIRDEQRLYDNPQNALSRLMGAGISRDAAIQMLSGAGGSGSGGLVTGDAAAFNAGIPASQSALNQNQQSLDIANTAFNGLGAVCGLVSLGLSIPQSIAQTQMMQMQNFLTSEQLAAYKSAGTAYQILNAAGVASESFGSVSAAAAAISKLAQDGNSDAASFIASGGIDAMRKNAPFASRTLGDLYKSERSSSDYDRQFRLFTENQEADTELKKVNSDLITMQIENFQEQLDNLRADTQYKRDLAALQRANAILLGKQGKLVDQQTLSLELNNNLEQSFQTAVDVTGKTGLQLYTDQRMQELISSVNRLSKLNDEGAWEKEADTLLKSYDNAIALYELGSLYERGEINFIQNADKDTKDLIYFCRAAEKTGLFDYIHTMVDSETAGNTHFGAYGGSRPAEHAFEVLNQHAPRKKPWYRRFFTRQPKNHD